MHNIQEAFTNMDNLLQTPADPADDFLASVERQALRMAELATKNTVDAMEIVDITVRRWVKKYHKGSPSHWLTGFFIELERTINLFQRRQLPISQWFRSRTEVQFWQELGKATDGMLAQQAHFNKTVLTALAQLPLPQQQAFLLCAWQGFSVEDAAYILAEPVNTIANRYHSAALGLGDALEGFNEPTASAP